MSTTSHKLWSIPGLVLLAVLLVAAIAVTNQLFKGQRIDLTENRLYTMTEGTRNILGNIDEPINLYFYFSDTTSEQLSQLRTYAKRVQETLEEYELRSKGKIRLQVIDPLPFSEEEDQAAQFGLQAVPVSVAGDSVYFGLVGTNAWDDQSVIPFFQAEKEAFLEYDLTKLVHSLANPKKTVIGLMTTLPMSGGMDPMTRQSTPGWMILEQIQQLFEVRNLAVTATEIDADIDVLMLVHPKNMGEDTVFAIEQFLFNGGRALMFVDPHAEADRPPTDPNDPSSMFQSRSSDLSQLFATWGLQFDASRFVGDVDYALAVRSPDGIGQVRHVGLIGVTSESLNQEDVTSADLDSINFGFAGSLSVADDAAVAIEPLVSSSRNSGMLEAQSLLFSQDPTALLDNLTTDDQVHTLAARVSGTVKTAFAERVAAAESTGAGFKASGEVNAIIFADADVLVDGFWVRVQNFFGRRLASAFASNGDLVFNALDNLTGNADLISIRGRETYQRPFKIVTELQRKAEETFRKTEERLQNELTMTEQRLGELQTGRTDQGAIIMTPEQQAEIDSFLEQKVRIRKELRDVRRNLDKDITDLGFRLKAINIVAVPLLLTVFALVRGLRQRKRKKQ